MAFYKTDTEFTYSILEGFDHILEEKGNQYTSLRKISWNDNGTYKLDIRRYYTTPEGEEKMGKGISFMTDEGPAELINALLQEGYGDTAEVVRNLKDRDDFRSALNSVLNPEDEFYDKDAKDIKADYYDPKELLLA